MSEESSTCRKVVKLLQRLLTCPTPRVPAADILLWHGRRRTEQQCDIADQSPLWILVSVAFFFLLVGG